MTRATWFDNSIRKGVRKASRLQKPLEKWIFPVILFLWPLWGFNSGVDVSDATYSLGNYLYLKDGMWFFSTFLANKIGAFLAGIPLGGQMMSAMNIKTGLILSVTVLICYYVLRRMMPGWMVFLGEMLAVSLFWSPHVILYNLLSYVFLTFACLCLFLGESGIPRKRRYYWMAGIFLGINLFVRFSNALQVVLILAVWLGGYWSHRNVKTTVKDTGACIGGYAIGAGSIFLWTALEYGAGAWIGAISQLFSIGGDYTFGEMMRATASAYGTVLRWMLIMTACVIFGVIIFALPMFSSNRWVKRTAYIIGIVLLFRFFWGRGVYTVNYQDYWCMFNWAMMFIVLAIAFDLIGIFGGFRATTDERFLSAMSLILILILPFGSNNYTFPVLLDLFITAPFFLWMFRRVWQEARTREMQFPWYSMVAAVIIMTMVQGSLFHMSYSFRDGTDGTPRDAVIRTCIQSANGMRTTEENRDELDSLYTFLGEQGFLDPDGNGSDRKLVAFGNAPGLNYLMAMEPGLSTTWPDLASFPEEQFDKEIAELGGLAYIGHTDELPVVIWYHAEDPEESMDAQERHKAETLEQFLLDADYRTAYEEGNYEVFLPQAAQRF